MPPPQATALAHPNIALVKYWGNRDDELRIPANGSISLTLAGMQVRTTVRFDEALKHDQVSINGESASSGRASVVLDLVRDRAGIDMRATVDSHSDFPAGAGLASSAAAFAALSLAASSAAGLELSPEQLSRLARRGSGSAARSIFGGYVELLVDGTDAQCYARQLADAGHWELVDLVAIVDRQPKAVGSTAGHARADSSPLQQARVADAPRRLENCRAAIQARDFQRLAEVAELDSDLMHAVMMTSEPSIHYWQAGTVQLMAEVRGLRRAGVPVFYSIDAGPNVHCLCTPEVESEVRGHLEQIPAVQTLLRGAPGSGAVLLEEQ